MRQAAEDSPGSPCSPIERVKAPLTKCPLVPSPGPVLFIKSTRARSQGNLLMPTATPRMGWGASRMTAQTPANDSG